MSTDGCPARDVLESLLSGTLDEPALSTVERHIDSCPACQAVLATESLGAGDTLLSALRHPSVPDAYAEEPGCREGLARVAAMVPGVGGTAGAEPSGPGSDGDAVSPESVESPDLGTIREYRLLEKLGEGGMGAVYKAVHRRLEKVVALKVLPADRVRNAGAVARFEREMKAIGRLEHPHIVRAMDAGEEDGTHFLVMEYVDGVDLDALSRCRGPFPVADACELVRQAALGLQEAHEHGMVHRDVKPSNLILARSPRRAEPPQVKILDLGLALLGGSGEAQGSAGELTGEGQIMGTVNYMAPEQCLDSHEVDGRADVYSLGATLFKLLTGKHPLHAHASRPLAARLLALANEPAPDVRTLRPDLPAGLADLLRRLLAKDPADRPATPRDVVEMLRPFCDGADLARVLDDEDFGPSTVLLGHETHSLLASASAETATVLSEAAAPAPAPVAQGTGNRRPPTKHLLAAAGGLAAVLLAGVVFFWQTRQGTVRIEIDDDQTTAQVDAQGVTIRRGDERPIRLIPGTHGLRIRRGDLEFETVEFVLRKGETTTLKIELLRGEVQVRTADGQPVGTVKPRGTLVADTTPDPKSTSPAPPKPSGPESVPPPVAIDEPPPLEEWLKGRKILTVAQNGSGQFRTIQAALEALQPGEAVRVLDQGPYRELLTSTKLPRDTGLFSTVQAIVEAPHWRHSHDERDPVTGKDVAVHMAHGLGDAGGFRLHGFEWRFPGSDGKRVRRLVTNRTAAFVVEDCLFRAGDDGTGQSIFFYNRDPGDGLGAKVVIRDCVFQGSVTIRPYDLRDPPPEARRSQALVVRNAFFGADVEHHLWLDEAPGGTFVVRHNVFAGKAVHDVVLDEVAAPDAIEVSNNLLGSKVGISVATHVPRGRVALRNNLRLQGGLVRLLRGAWDSADQTASWRVDHNLYPDPEPLGPTLRPVPRFAGDVAGLPVFLSKVPQEREYLRVAVDDPLASRGAGGDWPSYIGALPPGPAAKEGDWFTRLRERWGVLTPAASGTEDRGYELELSGRDDKGFAWAMTEAKLPLDSPCTVEMYARPRSWSALSRGLFSAAGGLELKDSGDFWQWIVYPDVKNVPPMSEYDKAEHSPKIPRRRVHLAGVVTPTEIRLYVDGRMAATTRLRAPLKKATGQVGIGGNSNPERWTPFDGTVDEIRISTKVRYEHEKDFVPPPRFETDDDTWALYHCDEGSGDRLVDSSGNGHHAKIHGPLKWVRPAGSGSGTGTGVPPAAYEPPVVIDEPPPLEEWLKGRTVLTVAQDGSGEFRTIQAALEALKPGEVVEVLDQGPYRENLGVMLPADVGLISRRGTVLELAGVRKKLDLYDREAGHAFLRCDGFRVSGFDFAVEKSEAAARSADMNLRVNGECVVENCRFRRVPRPKDTFLACHVELESSARRCVVRECVFHQSLQVVTNTTGKETRIVLTRNWWPAGFADLSCMRIWGSLAEGVPGPHVTIRGNICEGVQSLPLGLISTRFLSSLNISDNTFANGQINVHGKQVGAGTVRGNVLGLLTLRSAPEGEKLPDLDTWRIGGNRILNPVDAAGRMPPSPTDSTGPIAWLSNDRAHRDFLRLPAGHAPVGALPPGPAPKEGDWFTRLRERWGTAPGDAAVEKPAGPSPFDRIAKGTLPPTDPPVDPAVPLVAVFGETDLRFKHWGRVLAVAFSPDGKWLASASVDRTVKLWETETGRLLGTLLPANEAACLEFSRDGKSLHTGSDAIETWDVETRERTRTIGGFKFGAVEFAVSPDGRLLAVADRSRHSLVDCDGVKFFDLSDGTPRGRLPLTDPVVALAFSPDGGTLATAGKTSTIRLWDVAKREETGTLDGHEGEVVSLAFHPEEPLLASLGRDRRLILRDWRKREVRHVFRDITAMGTGRRTAFLPGGRELAVASEYGAVQLLDVRTGQVRREFASKGTSILACAPVGRRLAVGEAYHTIRLWDIDTGRPSFPPRSYEMIHNLDVSRDGSRIAVVTGQMNLAKVLEIPSGKELATIGPLPGNLQDVSLSPDGRFVATASGQHFDTGLNLVELWDLSNPARPVKTFVGAPDGYFKIAFDPVGRRLAAGGVAGDLRLWDVATGQGIDVPQAHAGQVRSLRWSPDGRTLATVSRTSKDRSIRLWDAETGKSRRVVPDACEQHVHDLAFSPDGTKLLSGDFYGGQARLWDAATGNLLRTLPYGTGHHVAFRPDGRQFAAISGGVTGTGGVLHLRNAETFAAEGRFPVGPGDPAPLLTYAPDGRHVVLGNGNGMIYVLRLAPPPVSAP